MQSRGLCASRYKFQLLLLQLNDVHRMKLLPMRYSTTTHSTSTLYPIFQGYCVLIDCHCHSLLLFLILLLFCIAYILQFHSSLSSSLDDIENYTFIIQFASQTLCNEYLDVTIRWWIISNTESHRAAHN